MSCIIFLYCCRISARESWSHLRSHTHQESGGNWISHQWKYLMSTCEFVSCILHSYFCRITVRKSLRRNPCYGIVLIVTSGKHLRSPGSGGNWIIKRWNYLISPREFVPCILHLYCCRISARKSWSHLRSHTHQESWGNWISHQWKYLISTCEFVSCILHS